MRYFGGKSKIAKYIVPFLESNRKDGQTFLEPFVGGANIASKMSGQRICCDFNEYLIEMYNGVQSGYKLPNDISEEEYKHIKDNKDENKILTGFVGFGCSFAGKWFGGYARCTNKYNYCQGSKKSLLRKMDTLTFKDTVFLHKDYKLLTPNGMLIYADPPYANTTKYSGTPSFDSNEFWEVMREWSLCNDVYISEYNAPDDFECVLEIPTKTIIRDKSGNVLETCEKLFKYKNTIQI